MRRFRYGVVVALFALVGCAKKGGEADATGSAPRSKADKCKQIGREAGRIAMFAAGAMAVGLSEDKGSAKEALKEVGPAAADAAAQLEAACMSWSDEAIDCLVDPLKMAFNSDACEVAVGEALGHPQPPKDVPAGPSPTWSHRFEGKPTALRLRSDGLLVARFSDYQSGEDGQDGTWYRAMVGVRDGAEVWTRSGRFGDTIVELGDDGYAVIADGALELLDPETGASKWTWRPKPLPVPDFDPEWMSPPQSPRVRAVARDSDALLVATADARFFSVPKTGVKAKELHQLPDEEIDEARLYVSPDGTRWLWESYDLRAFDTQWVQRVGIRAHDSLGAVAVRHNDAVVLIDSEVMVLDPNACASTEVVAPSGWPHAGELASLELDECPGCPRAPSGCVKWSHYVADAANEPMTLLAGGRVVVNDGEHTHALDAGATAWKSATAAGGRAAVGRFVFALMPGDDESGPAKLWALDSDSGNHLWLSPLPARNEGWLYSTDEVHLEAAGPWLIAGYATTVSAFRLEDSR